MYGHKMLQRLRKSVLKRWSYLTWRHGFRVVRKNGLLWLLNPRNFVDRQLGVFGDFEPAQRQRLFAMADGPVDMFLDIGANFGLYTVEAVSRGVAHEYHAFEPDPRNRAQLAANLYLNGQTMQVAVHPQAVSNSDGTVAMTFQPETSTGTSRISEDQSGGTSVSCVKLDSVFSTSGRRVLVKIDIEGHETQALEGMAALLANNTCALQIETFDDSRDTVLLLMQRYGYSEAGRIEQDSYFVRAVA